MTFDPTKIAASKRIFRQRLAAKPIEEKLAMLDALRARAIAMRGSDAEPHADTLKEAAPAYQTQSKRTE